MIYSAQRCIGVYAALLVTGAGVLTGCGGGGGGTSATPAPPLAPLSTTDRLAVPGDTFSYEGTALYKPSSSGLLDLSPNVTLKAEATVRYARATFDEREVLEESRQMKFTSPALEFPVTTYSRDFFVRDADGERRYLAYETADRQLLRIISQTDTTPVTYTPGSTTTITTRYANGTSDTRTFTVEDSETITVPVGRFAVWRCVRVDGTGDNTIRTVLWIAPQVGTVQRRQTERTDQGTFAYTLKLTGFTLL